METCKQVHASILLDRRELGASQLSSSQCQVPPRRTMRNKLAIPTRARIPKLPLVSSGNPASRKACEEMHESAQVIQYFSFCLFFLSVGSNHTCEKLCLRVSIDICSTSSVYLTSSRISIMSVRIDSAHFTFLSGAGSSHHLFTSFSHHC